MTAFIHPSEMTQEQRRVEIAIILARGYLRLRAVPKDSAVNRDVILEMLGDKSVYAPTKPNTKTPIGGLPAVPGRLP